MKFPVSTQSALLAAFVTGILVIAVLIRGRRTPLHNSFAWLNLVLCIWSAARFFFHDNAGDHLYKHVALFASIFIPIASLRFFGTFLEEKGPRISTASRWVWIATAVFVPVAVPFKDELTFQVILGVFVYLTLFGCVALILRRARSAERRTDAARFYYLAFASAAVTTTTLLEFIPAWIAAPIEIPAVGDFLLALWVFFLMQIIIQDRLLGLSELLGKLAVVGSMAGVLALLYIVLNLSIGSEGLVPFYTLLVAFVVLILFEPMSQLIEERVNRLLFRERYEFARQMAILRREIANVVDVDELAALLISRLQDTRRVTRAALYVLDDDVLTYRPVASTGHDFPHLDAATDRLFFQELREDRALLIDDLVADLGQARQRRVQTGELEGVIDVVRSLGADVVVPLTSDDRITGLVVVGDERVREAYSPDEIRSLVQIAGQAAISVENSRLVEGIRERERLAALGEMAAGLAHEIRNPLGAIKGAAQFLSPVGGGVEGELDEQGEFLDIIIEEVNRLNGVVSQFLDYARPYRGESVQCDVNSVVEKTGRLWRPTAEAWQVECVVEFEDVPPVRADPELLRQVFLNLALNAIQATGTRPEGDDPPGAGGRGPRFIVRTRLTRRMIGVAGRPLARDMVEVQFIDNGRGIPAEELDRIFIPFFTTKQRGTGLGLAVSQRIIENLGGKVEVQSQFAKGTTFRVLLPLWDTTVS
jgi:two-component system, NtrC family, sensor histidine kinase HydH